MVSDLFKKLFFLVLITLFATAGKAQQTHFIYLQTDNGQPFYLKMNHKIISSSSEGFVILPGLTDSTYEIKVGFPKNEHPEETFDLNVNNNNQGFLIKNFEDKGTQLFNMETLALIDGTNNLTKDTSIAAASNEKKEADPFTQLLANVVKDSSILENHQVVTDQPIKQSDTTAHINNDSNSIAHINNDSNSIVQKTDTSVTNSNPPVAITPEKADSSVTSQGNPSVSKILSKENEQGLTMLYADSSGNSKDTVNIFIPGEKPAVSVDSLNNDSAKAQMAKSKNQDISSFTDSAHLTITPTVPNQNNDSNNGFVLRKDSITTKTNTVTAPEQVFIIGPQKEKKNSEKKENQKISESSKNENDSSGQQSGTISQIQISDKGNENTAPDKKADNGNKMEVLPKVVTSSRVNSDCKDFATTEDFLRLRKKMASESSDAAMIRVANKYFKSKCYSTSQVKDLSYLFLTNEGKYMFFDAAYSYTSDSDLYETLESQFTDDYYLNRFKAMIRK